jgi:hypothetical protein
MGIVPRQSKHRRYFEYVMKNWTMYNIFKYLL